MANAESLTHLYTTLVRPHLEYACPVWAPYTRKDTELLESVQRFACKMATHCWNSSYEELLAHTDLPTLERRRLHLKLSHLYKIVHHQSFFPNGIVSLRAFTTQFSLRSFSNSTATFCTYSIILPFFCASYYFNLEYTAL